MIHAVGVADATTTSIYKDGVFKDCDRYTGTGSGPCRNYCASGLWVTHTSVGSPRFGSNA